MPFIYSCSTQKSRAQKVILRLPDKVARDVVTIRSHFFNGSTWRHHPHDRPKMP